MVAEDVFMGASSVLPERLVIAVLAVCLPGLDPAVRVLPEPARFTLADSLVR
jgi:hypothetical protein